MTVPQEQGAPPIILLIMMYLFHNALNSSQNNENVISFHFTNDSHNIFQMCSSTFYSQTTANETIENFSIVNLVKRMKKYCSILLNLLPEVVKYVKLLLSMSAANTINERSFSALRQVKKYLRSTMKDKRMPSG